MNRVCKYESTNFKIKIDIIRYQIQICSGPYLNQVNMNSPPWRPYLGIKPKLQILESEMVLIKQKFLWQFVCMKCVNCVSKYESIKIAVPGFKILDF